MMKLSLTLEPGADFSSDCATAVRLGFDAAFISIRNHPDPSDLPAVTRLMQEAGLSPCGVQSVLGWRGPGDAGFVPMVRRSIDVAAQLCCPLAGLVTATPTAGRTPSSTTALFRDVLLPLGGYATARGVRLLLGNGGLFSSARHLWALLDQLPREAFGCEWDLGRGVESKESPAVAVPMLNLRLGCVSVPTGSTTERSSRPCTGWPGSASQVI